MVVRLGRIQARAHDHGAQPAAPAHHFQVPDGQEAMRVGVLRVVLQHALGQLARLFAVTGRARLLQAHRSRHQRQRDRLLQAPLDMARINRQGGIGLVQRPLQQGMRGLGLATDRLGQQAARAESTGIRPAICCHISDCRIIMACRIGLHSRRALAPGRLENHKKQE